MSPNDSAGQRRTFAAFGLAAFLILTGALGTVLHLGRAAEIAKAEEAAERLAHTLDEHTRSSVEAIEAMLDAKGRALELLIARQDATPERLEALLHVGARSLSHVRALSFVDAEGAIRAGSDLSRLAPGSDVAAQERFNAHKSRRASIHIGRPVRDPAGDRWLLSFSRRIDFPDGRFAGLLHAVFEPRRFQEFYAALQVGPNSSLNLLRDDGVLLVREPGAAGSVGHSFAETPLFRDHLPVASSGTFRSTAPTDGTERILSYRRLPQLPLVVMVGIATQDALAAWWGSLGTAFLVWIAGGGGVAGLTTLAYRMQRRRALIEAALETKEAHHRTVLDTAHDAFVEADIDGTIVSWNTAAERLFGWAAAEIVGRPLAETIIPERFRAAHLEGMARFRASGGAAQSGRRIEVTAATRDGRELPVEMSLSATTTSGAWRFTAFIRDVSERKEREHALMESEARHRLLAESATDVIVRRTLDHRRTYVSPAAREVLGYEPEELLGKSALDIVHPEDLELARASFAQLRPGHERATATYRLRRKDGTCIWVEVAQRLIPAPGSDVPQEIVSAARDVSERKRQERELAEARAAAEAASRAKGQFLANLSHELRTPLNAVIGFSDLIARETEGPVGAEAYKEFAVSIRDSGQHLLELINEVLDHARAEAGQLVIVEDTVDLEAAARFAQRMMAPRAQRAGVRVTCEVAPEAARIRADERRIRQILLNLLSNAVKYTAAGGTVAVSATVEPDGRLRLAVSDQGVGIPEADLERVLEPFTRVETAANRRIDGTGLGLPLTRRLVELHGGTMGLRSVLGEGTVVTLHFPPERVLRGRSRGPVATAGPPVPATILLVEDDPLIRLGTTAVLEGFGHSVVQAANANEALAVLRGTGPIDLLFSDIVMPPGMNGVELARLAEGLRPGIAVLLTSGFAPHAVAGEEGAAWGHELLPKPYTPGELARRLAPLLSGLAQPRASRPSRILLAEDAAPVRMHATTLLKAAGHVVEAVEDGEAAVAAARENDYDLVLMDVVMPGMDGLAATRAIRALTGPRAAVRIIALTGMTLPEDVARCTAAGMDGHLAKPVNRETLLAAVGSRSGQAARVASLAH